MAVDFSRFGTRITLNERFALIRKEVQKRAIHVNESIDFTNNRRQKDYNSYNQTLSHDRPSAELRQGSEKNRRLVLQMASQPSVMSELHNFYPNNNVHIMPSPILPTPVQTNNVKQRLGALTSAPLSAPKQNVKARLSKVPIHRRLDFSNRKSGNFIYFFVYFLNL